MNDENFVIVTNAVEDDREHWFSVDELPDLIKLAEAVRNHAAREHDRTKGRG